MARHIRPDRGLKIPLFFLILIILLTHTTSAYNTDFETKLAKSIFQQQTTRTNTLVKNDYYSFDAPPHYLFIKNTYEGGILRPYYFAAYGKSNKQRVRTDKQISIALYTLDNTTWKKLLESHPTKKLKRTHTNQYAYITETYQKNKNQRTYTKTAIYKDQPILIKYNAPLAYKYYVKDFDMIMNTLEFTSR